MLKFLTHNLASLAWGLTIIADGLAILVWGQTFGWQLGQLSLYTIFPLLGLIAFSTMWAQYMSGMLRRLLGVELEGSSALSRSLQTFSNITGFVVTTSILLHPSLLIYQLFRDGAGLPPGSYLHYVQRSKEWAVLLGSLSFFVFMAYELHHKYHDRPWWKYINYANDVAILAIFLHALSLGSHISASWIHGLWLFYGVTLAAALIHKHTPRLSRLRLGRA